MKLKNLSITSPVGMVAIVTLVILMLSYEVFNKNSLLNYGLRSLKGMSSNYEQKAAKLAKDINTVPEFKNLQPWAVNIMAEFRNGQIHTNGYPELWWVTNGVKLAPEQTPNFIKNWWGSTNNFGEVWPQIVIVMDKNQPDYVVIDWGDEWGVVVGTQQYRLTFQPTGLNELAPGVYTYFGEH